MKNRYKKFMANVVELVFNGGEIEVKADFLPFAQCVKINFSGCEKYVIKGAKRAFLHHEYSEVWNQDGCVPVTEFTGDFEIKFPELVDTWVSDGNGNPVLKKCYKGGTYSPDKYHYPIEMDNVITLDNGKFLIRDYDKYGSKLSILSTLPKVVWEETQPKEFNIASKREKIICRVYGEYFITKKGTKCFRVNPNGKHMMLRGFYGGAMRCADLLYDVRNNPEVIYHKDASSNGGGLGYRYLIVPRDWKQSLSEDDI